MIDVSADAGWLATSLLCMHLVQMAVQGRWLHDCTLLTLPHVTAPDLRLFHTVRGGVVECLPELLVAVGNKRGALDTMLRGAKDARQVEQVSSKPEFFP